MAGMGCNDPRHKEEFLAWLTERIEKAGESVVDPPREFKAALTSGKPKDLRPEVWREWYDHMNPGWEEAAKAAGGLPVPFSSESQHREKFLKWVKAKIEFHGFKPEAAPYGLKEALISGRTEDLNPEMLVIWEDHLYGRDQPNRPVNWGDPGQAHQGPRGGRYTEARTKDGRPYRRYF